MWLGVMEQACAFYSKFINCDTVWCIVSDILFRVLFVFCRYVGVMVRCLYVALDVLGLVFVSCDESLCCHMILGI